MSRVQVKICGITRPEDALTAAELGADAIGLNFHPASPRALDVEQAAAVAAAVPPFVTLVGLFVDAAPRLIETVLAAVPLDMLQFHGHEERADCERWGRPYLRALRTGAPDWEAGLDAYPSARGLLLDAYVPGRAGGTGETFDWGLVPASLSRPLVLAGGLRPDNVAQAIRTVRPWAVDVCGGVETAPGIKDPEAVKAFITEVALAAQTGVD